MEEKKKKKRIGAIFIQSILMACAAYAIPAIIQSKQRMAIVAIAITVLILFGLDYMFFKCTPIKKKSTKVGAGIGIALIELCVTFGVSVYCLAPSLLFYPNYDAAIYEEVQGYEKVEEVIIPTEDGQINGWICHNADDKAPLIIYYGGNGETASRRMKLMNDEALGDLFPGYNFAMFSYPGYDKSSGAPSSDSLKEMGLTVYDTMVKRQDVNSQKIYLWGFSIGTGVANYVASNREVSGMLLMAPYANQYDLYNRYIPIFHGPVQSLVAFDMRADQFAKNVKIKPTILASQTDEVVAYSSSLKLSRQYPNQCDLHTFDGIKHNDFWSMEDPQNVIKNYFREELVR